MPAHDVFHTAVKRGLIKEGWTITNDPLVILFGTLDVYIDLAAEKVIGAEKEGVRIAVEVKSFLGPSLVTDFHAALGQFLNYRIVLDAEDPERLLFLAVPEPTYTAFFSLLLAQMAVKRHGVHLIVYDPESEALVQWIKQDVIAS
jgi:XisH protein